MGKVLFICTGNYYRSRLAEILFNHYAREEGLPWSASSRGISIQSGLKGLSPYPVKYFEGRQMALAPEDLRDPLALSIDDFQIYDVVVLLNQSEHLPMMEMRFSWMVKALQKEGKLRLWNVHDVFHQANPVMKMLGAAKDRRGQPEESAVEHIDFGVRALVHELSRLPQAAEPPLQGQGG